MTRIRTNQNTIGGARWFLLVLIVGFHATSCAPLRKEQELTTIDKVLTGVADPKMQERWKQADGEEKLPPIDAIPTPKQRVSVRRPAVVKEPPARMRRPVMPAETVAEAQLFSLKPITRYDGPFQVTKHKPGVIIGEMQRIKEQVELYYKLPDKQRQIAIPEGAKLQLRFRDVVVDGALQRRIILRTEEGAALFVYIAEGSQQPYRQTIDDLKLNIEQQRTGVHPLVKVTYTGNTVTLKQGERQKIGEGKEAVNVYLLESTAMSPQRVILQEGQPFYINLVLYRVQ